MNRIEADRAVAYIVHELRPDWDRPGIERVLAKLHASEPLACWVAALYATKRTDQRTPAVIAIDGPHWRDAPGQAPTPTPPRPSDPNRCRVCGLTRGGHDRANTLVPEDAQHQWTTEPPKPRTKESR